MFQSKLIEKLGGLADPAERHSRARGLAELMGVTEVLLFCRDPELGILLPAPGFPQTLLGGNAWTEFLSECGLRGQLEAVLPNPLTGLNGQWFGYLAGSDTLLAIESASSPSRERVEALLGALPILGAVFVSEQKAINERATAQSCIATAEWAKNLAAELDIARRELQRSLVEVRRSKDRNLFLLEASRRLSMSLDCDTMLQQCAGILIPQIGDAAHIHFRDSAALYLHKAFTDKARDPELDEAVRKQVHQIQKTRAIAVETNLRFEIVSIPLFWRFELNGSLTLTRMLRCGAGFTKDDLALLEDFSDRFAVFLENSFLHRDTQLAVRAREEFLSIASHELKTPLTTILLGHQLVKRKLKSSANATEMNPSVFPLLDSVEEQLKNLGSLINTLLDVTRACQPNLSLESTDFDISALTDKIAGRFREAAQLAGSQIRVQGSPAWVHCDELRIEQAINNLITNAIKYGGGREIDVATRTDGGLALVTVRDRGIGISAADQERIFNRFERAVDYKKISGLGLGLYITKRIIEAHGGTIRVQSAPGQGASFEFRLPSLAMLRPMTVQLAPTSIVQEQRR